MFRVARRPGPSSHERGISLPRPRAHRLEARWRPSAPWVPTVCPFRAKKSHFGKPKFLPVGIWFLETAEVGTNSCKSAHLRRLESTMSLRPMPLIFLLWVLSPYQVCVQRRRFGGEGGSPPALSSAGARRVRGSEPWHIIRPPRRGEGKCTNSSLALARYVPP